MLIILFIIGFIGILILGVVISNLKYRATQHLLKGTGISSAEINSNIENLFEPNIIQSLTKDFPNYNEQSIKNILAQYGNLIVRRQYVNSFSQDVYNRMQSDKKLINMQTMTLSRVSLTHYGNNKLSAMVTYNDGRDEYNMSLVCTIFANQINVDYYRVDKGAVIGF